MGAQGGGEGVKRLAAGVVIVCTIGCASAPMRPPDIQRELAWQGLHVVDIVQTLSVNDSEQLCELNPLLGRNPGDDSVLVFGGVMALVHYGVTKLLPVRYRPRWQWLSIGLKLGAVANNYYIGMQVERKE